MTDTNTNAKQLITGSLKVILEASLVFLLVVGVCWGLGNLAEHQANRPIASSADGVISLPAAKATLIGSVELGPTDKEKQTADFAYHFGRELLAERNGRTISAWSGEDASVQWQFVVAHGIGKDTKTPYKIVARLAAPPQSAGNRFSVSIVDVSHHDEPSEVKRFESTVDDTGGWKQWQTVSLGQTQLAPGTYRLIVKPAGPIKNNALMALGGIELQPTGKTSVCARKPQ